MFPIHSIDKIHLLPETLASFPSVFCCSLKVAVSIIISIVPYNTKPFGHESFHITIKAQVLPFYIYKRLSGAKCRRQNWYFLHFFEEKCAKRCYSAKSTDFKAVKKQEKQRLACRQLLCSAQPTVGNSGLRSRFVMSSEVETSGLGVDMVWVCSQISPLRSG